MENKKRVYRTYQETLIERLKNPLEAISYLRAALADEDERIFLLALRDVWEAQDGNLAALFELDLKPKKTRTKTPVSKTKSKASPTAEHAPSKR
jgi:hypothetical protein